MELKLGLSLEIGWIATTRICQKLLDQLFYHYENLVCGHRAQNVNKITVDVGLGKVNTDKLANIVIA